MRGQRLGASDVVATGWIAPAGAACRSIVDMRPVAGGQIGLRTATPLTIMR
jgi:hypothetical protein